MTCDERRDQWLLLASGGLEAEEARELHAHLEGGCPRCAGARAEAEALVALLPVGLPPVPPPPGLRERVLERAAAAPSRRPRPAVAQPGFWSLGRLAAAAALAAVALALGFLVRHAGLESRLEDQARRIAELGRAVEPLERTVADQAAEIARLQAVVGPASDVLAVVEQQRDEIGRLTASLAEVRGTLEARDSEVRRLRLQVDDQAMRLASYRSTDVRIFSLEGTAESRDAFARVFWNTERRRWDFYASGLTPAGLAKTYQLWFVTGDGRKVSAGTFDVRADGEAELLDVQVPLDVGVVVAAGVTDEPAGGSLQPTGRMHLLGEARRS